MAARRGPATPKLNIVSGGVPAGPAGRVLRLPFRGPLPGRATGPRRCPAGPASLLSPFGARPTPHRKDLPMTRRLPGLALLLLLAPPATVAEYKLGPDSMEQPGVPRGKVTKHSWASQVFPGTVRDYW